MLIVLVAVVVLGLVVGLRAKSAGVTVAVVLGAVALFVVGLGGARGGSDAEAEPPRLTVLSPLDGTEVTSPVSVAVSVERAGGRHIDVGADGACDGVHVDATGREAELTLAPGEHEICVRLVDAGHRTAAVEQRVTVRVS